ncbi:MAG: transcriptional repressor LexA [Alphaproteobacteria bacterium]|nr:transcriptional repressor LexA [Rhodospirillales bacterium]MCW9045733.1 transcriptional repressor LexA [Alphaproteobacteria bacterium]
MLTKKQYELLVFIDARLNETGVAPSYDEMKDALDLKSKSGIHRLVTGLEERGFIRRLPHRARALEVMKLPSNATAGDNTKEQTKEKFTPNVIQGNFQPPAASGSPDAEAVEIPFVGKIAAGTPIEALQDPSEFINIPASLMGGKDCYALQIEGDSMIEAGINDGDTVIIEQATRAENGAIVVALVDNEEATLKKLRRKGDSIALEPANVNYETKILPADRVKVQGRLVGLFRKY